MSLDLDKRQRAMLSEMGIALWQPVSAKGAELVKAVPEPAAPRGALSTAPSSAPAQPSVTPQAGSAGIEPAWQLGQPQPIYPAPSDPVTSISWLVLAELPAGATEPLEGEAGQLLDNMLRAAGMHRDAALQFVPLERARGAEPVNESPSLYDQVVRLVHAHRPSVVLVMGRLVAQALLPSDQPFAKRRGQALSLAGCPLLLTYDTTYLLRNLPEKARAWEDLCLARGMAAQALSA